MLKLVLSTTPTHQPEALQQNGSHNTKTSHASLMSLISMWQEYLAQNRRNWEGQRMTENSGGNEVIKPMKKHLLEKQVQVRMENDP